MLSQVCPGVSKSTEDIQVRTTVWIQTAVISLTGLLFDLTMTSIENLLLQTHLNQTIIALNPTSIFKSLSLLPYAGLLGTLLTLTANHLLLNFPVFESFHLLKMQTSSVTFCALY